MDPKAVHLDRDGRPYEPQIKTDGVRLMVEVDLSFEQFRALLAWGRGSPVTDWEVVEAWLIVRRRILPPDAGSFCGIGCDVNRAVVEYLNGL